MNSTPLSGPQKCTYDFKVDAGKNTGKAISQDYGAETQRGKVCGDDVVCVEMLNIEDMEVRVVYKGKPADDEITFTRQVGVFATGQLVAE